MGGEVAVDPSAPCRQTRASFRLEVRKRPPPRGARGQLYPLREPALPGQGLWRTETLRCPHGRDADAADEEREADSANGIADHDTDHDFEGGTAAHLDLPFHRAR